MDRDAFAMTDMIKTSTRTAIRKTDVLLTVKKITMEIANASTVTKKFSQKFAENATKTQFGSMATVLLLVESMNSTTQRLKNASAIPATGISTLSVLSALKNSSLLTAIVWCVQLPRLTTSSPINATAVRDII